MEFVLEQQGSCEGRGGGGLEGLGLRLDLYCAVWFQFYRAHSCSFWQHVVKERDRLDAIFDFVHWMRLRWSLRCTICDV